MFGPVSMSASFPKVAKDMMVYYYSHYFKHDKNLVSPKQAYQYSNNINDIKDIFNLNDRKKILNF